jgi:hypothetical protein
MKQPRLLWFLALLILISLSCNLFVPGQLAGVTSVSVTPHSGSGDFQVSVQGEAQQGSTLRCYIPEEDANGKRVQVEKFNQPLKAPGSADKFGFNTSFTFNYTVPGNHTLICTLGTSSELAWNEDFTVTSDSEPQAPSSDQTSSGPIEISGTATVMVFPTSSAQPSPCPTQASKVLLTVNPDNTAQLVVAFPVPEVDCSASPSSTGDLFTLFGSADPAAKTLKLTQDAGGSCTILTKDLAYTAGGLSGLITLTWSKGSLAGQTAFTISMP